MDKPIIDILWVAVSAGLVFLMQAGFLCLETGLTRSKNNINVAMKILADFAIATIIFWVFGYAFMFGTSQAGWIGLTAFIPDLGQERAWFVTFLVFQVMFCAASVTILSGAVAERMRFGSFLFIAALISGLTYPIFGHWAWNGADGGSRTGWLGASGFVDFAGSSVVHSVGGWTSLATLLVLGPRAGRFPKAGPPRKIPGADTPVAALGVLLLWLGWFGFNGGSTLAMNNQVAPIIANTLIAGAAGLVAALALGWRIRGRADVDMVINGSLAGLVAITANAHAVTVVSAVIIGAIGAGVMMGVETLLERLRIDDAVGAIPVHLGAGIWGTLAVGVFGQVDLLGTGLDRGSQLGIQVVGIVVCFLWTFGVTYVLLRLMNPFFPLRVTPEAEHIGLNISEHGASTELVDLLTIMERQAKTGDLSLRVPVEPFTEVGQIADLYNQVLAALDQAVARTRMIVGTARDGIITFSKHGLLITSLNPAVETIFGYPENELAGQPITLLFGPQRDAVHGPEPPHAVQTLPEPIVVGPPRELIGRRRDGEIFPLEVVVAEAESGPEEFYVGTFRDITERKQMEQARARLQEEIIQAQAATLAELSTPLIPISDQSLVMPLIGSVDSQRAQRVLDELLCGVEAHRARVVIIDITGVPLVDTQVANTLVRAAHAVRLLGAQVVLTGVRPEVAQTLVELRVSLDSIIMESTLQNGIAYALERR